MEGGPENPVTAHLPVQWGCAGSSELGRDCRPVAKGEDKDETAETRDTREQRWPVRLGIAHERKPPCLCVGNPAPTPEADTPRWLGGEGLGLTEMLSG